MRAKLKSHTEQRQFAERQVQVQRQRQQQQMRRAPTSSSPIAPGGGSSGNGNGTVTGGGGDLRTHAWPERMQSSADFSKQSLAALSAYVDQLEAQAHSDAVRRATNSFGRGGDDGGGGGAGPGTMVFICLRCCWEGRFLVCCFLVLLTLAYGLLAPTTGRRHARNTASTAVHTTTTISFMVTYVWIYHHSLCPRLL